MPRRLGFGRVSRGNDGLRCVAADNPKPIEESLERCRETLRLAGSTPAGFARFHAHPLARRFIVSDKVPIGSYIHPETLAHRDAIHVAVFPVFADEDLVAGDRVALVEGTTDRVVKSSKPLGIVDPFLDPRWQPKKNQRFYLFLLPNTVTGMRHEWRHPSFPSVSPDADAKAASIEWMQDAAERLGVDYEDLIGDSELVRGDYINNGEGIRNRWYEIQEAFWKHREIITGEVVDEDSRGGFTCSC